MLHSIRSQFKLLSMLSDNSFQTVYNAIVQNQIIHLQWLLMLPDNLFQTTFAIKEIVPSNSQYY